ncbi:MAG: S8 family serine peptidase [Reyranella sp.]|uniref:S8 family serine peptidase n=1 Tax=Reyranella sp. TaxID=1929291 RepID=UPI001AD139A5|nr:S8 family serine peptidase [Reyranella sp.]MBN9086234.1 S8 family serine peptidase [Reyranella sp.]
MTEPAREAAASPSTLGLMAPAVHVREVAAQAIGDIAQILARASATIAPMLTETLLMPPSRPPGLAAVAGEFATPQPPPAELGRYQLVTAPEEKIEDLATELNAHRLVEAAYVTPPLLPAAAPPRMAAVGNRAHAMMLPAAPPPAPGTATPDFSAMQGYLNASPDGVDARWAWSQPGGRGDGVSIIDIEGGWCFDHEDLQHSVDGLVGGTALSDPLWRDHGTAVLSEIVGDDNGMGVIGIAPNARVAAISHSGESTPVKAIVAATKRLRPGDIMLLETQQAGPRFNFTLRDDQRGYIPVEWIDVTYRAVAYAVSQGIIVVSAGANGGENLDDPIYSLRPSSGPVTFPGDWVNPFDRTRRDSGSIIVGAGAPPSTAFGPDRARMGFSNFGAAVDTQGWGEEVVAGGYGFLQGGAEERRYTATFGGTSGASPMVVGALAAVQGIRKAMGRAPLTPAQARNLLRATGAPQRGNTTERIGTRPDIKQMVASMPA